MNLAGKKVLVTGAGGFIGSHLAERLVDAGCSVKALVHYNALGLRGWLDRSARAAHMEIVAGDLMDRGSVEKAAAGAEVIFHLGALIAIPYSYVAPMSYARVNIEGTLNVLTAAMASGAKVLQTSTSEVYGTARTVPITEEHPLQGQSPYSATKIGADKLAESYHASFGLPVVIVRPFNTYGPRQSSRAVIPTIITQCAAGSRVKLGATSPTRDLNFVADTVEGFVAAAQSDEAAGRVFNLGSGVEISIGDLAHKIGKLMGREIEIITEDTRLRPDKSEVFQLLADASQAKRVLGWQSRVGLDEGLQRTIAWFREHARMERAGQYVV
jgi:NAD dependent epimerase/dehydratase